MTEESPASPPQGAPEQRRRGLQVPTWVATLVVGLIVFGIAFAVFLFDRFVGSIFLTAAFVIGIGRVFIGAHYPADVAAGCLVGLASAVLVVRLTRPVIDWIVRLVERVSDPLLASLWRLLPSR